MRKREHIPWLLVFVLAILVIGMAGCSGRASISFTTALPRPSVSTAPSVTATASVTAAETNGWATYRDPRFAFQVPLPPGWQPASLTWPPQPDKGGYNYYIVQFFPPGPHGDPGPGASAHAPELIQMTVTLSGPATPSLAQNPGFSPEPRTVALGTTQVQLYDSGSPGYGTEIGRAAETTLGTYPMLFGMHYQTNGAWDPAVAQRDIALFLAVLQGFHPA